MYDKAIEVLNIFYDHGYIAYIVGGYPRDSLLNIDTNDIDICTNARPKDIISIFNTDKVSDVNYGSVKIIYKNVKFDVTTFRKDIKYENNRKPIKIKYINDLKKDLLRRDFTINTVCIDREGNYIDLLHGIDDINNKVIRTVGNPRYRIKEDGLRILRAIRFSSGLGFDIDKKTSIYIKKYGYLLKKLSSSRRKEELSKIFSSQNKEIGRLLIINYGLDKYLGLDNLNDVLLCDDIIGIWSQLKLSVEYDFNKNEKDIIKKVREMLNYDNIDNYLVYKYGLYVATVVGSIKGISIKKINDIYNNLVISSRKELCINGDTLKDMVSGKMISDILDKIEFMVVNKEIDNDRDVVIKFINDNYL